MADSIPLRAGVPRWLTLITLAAAMLGVANKGEATNRALLIGVTTYSELNGADLKGPANDVELVASILQTRDFEAEAIVKLTDNSNPGLRPTRDNILRELEHFAESASSQDFIYLHFGGHGSQQPATSREETDGLDEIFLPADAGGWDQQIGAVENAITDDEIGAAVDRIRRTGADVWLVFDSCHSGAMSRGVSYDEIRYRQLSPNALGVPPQSLTDGQALTATQARSWRSTIEREQDAKKGYLIVFSAAQSAQTTPELRLPLAGDSRDFHGLFTYVLMKALSRNRGLSYSQLGEQLMLHYRLLPWRRTQPLISGDALDQPVFREASASTELWPAFVGTDGSLHIQAGRMHGFVPDSTVKVFDNGLADEDSYVGEGVISQASPLASEIHGFSQAASGSGSDLYAALAVPAIEFTLTVAVAGPQSEALATTIREIATTNPLLKLADETDEPDIRVARFESRLWFLRPDQSLPCEYQMLAETAFSECQRRRDPQQLAMVAAPSDSARLSEAISSAIERIARAEALLSLKRYVSASGTHSPIEVTLSVRRDGKTSAYPGTTLPVFTDGDEIIIDIRNVASTPRDVSIVYRDAHYGITQLWPEPGQPNRVGPNESLPSLPIELFPEPEGQEDLIVLSQPGVGLSRDFAFLEQAPLGVASRGTPAANKKDHSRNTPLELLFAATLSPDTERNQSLEILSRGARKSARPELGAMHVFSWEVLAER